MIFLGIETSCDETAVAIVHTNKTIRANCIYSQINEHKRYGGVVPEIAARAHLSKLPALLDQALCDADLALSDIDALCATAGPGLIGGVLVGLNYAKSLAYSMQKPFYGINHLAGHALSVRLTAEVPFPYILLLISGGHTQLICVHGACSFELLGESRDDAAGETFDKTAKLLGLGHPGGAEIEKRARAGNPNAYLFPKPFFNEDHCDFSFSGLKTAVRKCVESAQPEDAPDIAASFQKTMGDILFERASRGILACHAKGYTPQTFVIAGGVGANTHIREKLTKLEEKFEISCIFPPMNLCTDNAAMIAWAGIEQSSSACIESSYQVQATPRWSLTQLSNNRTPLKSDEESHA